MKQKKIVITGGTGFIGSNIADRLKKVHDITIFDLKKPVEETTEVVAEEIAPAREDEKKIESDGVEHLEEETEIKPDVTYKFED